MNRLIIGKRLSLFAYLLIIESILIFSIVASILIRTAINGKSSTSQTADTFPNYRHLFRNYSILDEFLHLPKKIIPAQNPELEIKNPFILDILKLRTAASLVEEKKFDMANAILLTIDPSRRNSFIALGKDKLHLKYLYSQKKYAEFITLLNRLPLEKLELKLLSISCYIKTGNDEKAFDLFKKLFARHKLDTFEGYIPRQTLDQFLNRLEYNYWLEKFKSLVENNRYSEFIKESKYSRAPQLISLYHAEFNYNDKKFDRCREYLSAVTNEKLLGQKQRILVKIDLKQNNEADIDGQLAELKKTGDWGAYRDVLMDAAGITLNKEQPDRALGFFLKYIEIVKWSHLFISWITRADSKFSYIRNSDYWKALWFSAWLYYQKNEKKNAAEYFKQGMESDIDAYKVANSYWYQRLTGTPSINLENYSFSYYYIKTDKIDPVKSIKPFVHLLNNPQGPRLIEILQPLKELATYGLIGEAIDYIHWVSAGKDIHLTVTDKHLLNLIESILYLGQENYSMAFNRFRSNFENYQYVRLPRFLSRVCLPVKYEAPIDRYSRENKIDPAVIYSLIREESFFRPDAVSIADAFGLMQLLLRTAKETAQPSGVTIIKGDLFNPEINIKLGIEHLKLLLNKYNGKYYLVFAAYNAGQGRVDRWLEKFGNIPEDEFIEMIPFTATRNYVKNILRNIPYYKFYYNL